MSLPPAYFQGIDDCITIIERSAERVDPHAKAILISLAENLRQSFQPIKDEHLAQSRTTSIE